MIVVRLNWWELIRMMLGWYIQIELSPRGKEAQSYSQYLLPPWEKEGQFRNL